MARRSPLCEGKVIRGYGTFDCSNKSVWAVAPEGTSQWQGACSHHLVQVANGIAQGQRLTLIKLKQSEEEDE